jgi:hypothetical protein
MNHNIRLLCRRDDELKSREEHFKKYEHLKFCEIKTFLKKFKCFLNFLNILKNFSSFYKFVKFQ